jgi:hypothetical protein
MVAPLAKQSFCVNDISRRTLNLFFNGQGACTAHRLAAVVLIFFGLALRLSFDPAVLQPKDIRPLVTCQRFA